MRDSKYTTRIKGGVENYRLLLPNVGYGDI
jgi:hypothetical protein